jgi:hypothetical protein
MTEENVSRIDIKIAREFPQRLRCKLGLHKWSIWAGEDTLVVDLQPIWIQARVCIMCNKREYRTLLE